MGAWNSYIFQVLLCSSSYVRNGDKVTKNTRICKQEIAYLISCRIASSHVFVLRILSFTFGPNSTHERQTTKRIYPAAYGNKISILVKQELKQSDISPTFLFYVPQSRLTNH